MKMRLLYISSIFWYVISFDLTVECWLVNATGGSFSSNVYRETTFAYQFQDSADRVTYNGASSATGKCNIMGYWHVGDTLVSQSSIVASEKSRDTLICTDGCTIATCGFSSVETPRPDRRYRMPLVDFAGSDSVLKAADYAAFPDLQMLPALAGAVVPIYNIPELSGQKAIPLILSRQSIADIFKGKVLHWNDSGILTSNPLLRDTLSEIVHPIRLVVRSDSSGTSEIFTTALSLFDPIGMASPDYSFGSTVGFGSNPNWCGSVTDEVQIITITGCISPAPTVEKKIHLKIVNGNRNLRDVTFACDASSKNITGEFARSSPGAGLSVLVSKRSIAAGQIEIKIGYSDPETIGMKWYKPALISSPAGMTVTLSTLQEGGYLNSHLNSTYSITPQIQSIWINSLVSPFDFKVSWHGAAGATYDVYLKADSTTAIITEAFNAAYIGSVSDVKQVTSTQSVWVEHQIVFSLAASAIFSRFTITPLLQIIEGSVYITTQSDYDNYPLFYDNRNPRGFGGSGMYTCYLRQYSYNAWHYYTGLTNAGVIAEVYTIPYSIGYSVLIDATAASLSVASLINRAGVVVKPSAASVAYAVMDKGGNLDSNCNAVLADPSSANAWPISGFTYYVIRTQTHIGSCQRRTAAMKYLYYYYYSDSVKKIAADLGYATLPAFIRDIVAQKLVDSALCSNGQHALAEFTKHPIDLISSNVLSSVLSTYLVVYDDLETESDWKLYTMNSSRHVLKNFSVDPTRSAGVLTMLSGKVEKLQHFNNPQISTFAFAHISAVLIYHLDYFSSCSSGPLRVTSDIIAGIHLGQIEYWDDPIIQMANIPSSSCLPSQKINVVVHSVPSDAGNLFVNYLSVISPMFKAMLLAQEAMNNFVSFDFSAIIPLNRLISVTANNFADTVVIAQDSTFGFYLHTDSPSSHIASYCSDSSCAGLVIAPDDNGASVAACQQDPSTVINPSSNIYTYDLMHSSAVGCYPIAGTVDLSVLNVNDPSTCSTPGSAAYRVTRSKVKFGAFLFNGSATIKPLTIVAASPTTAMQRSFVFSSICDQTCNNIAVGYSHCSYRDCSWSSGDYEQQVSHCSPVTQRRTVTYTRTNSTCIVNPTTSPRSKVLIECAYVLGNSSNAMGLICMCTLGLTVCCIILFLTFKFSHEKVLRRSQIIFIYIFMVGAVLMNLTVLCMYGPNTDTNCLLRVWAVNLSSTLMLAPLIMKLHRVDVLLRTLLRGGRRKTISDFTVGLQVLSLLAVDAAILIAWTAVDRPKAIAESHLFKDTYEAVVDQVCNASNVQGFEKAMIAWKASLLAFGVIKSIQTWDVPKEISEAKHFAIAIYNIAVFGSFSYFLSVYGNVGTNVSVVLRCVGIFISATASAVVIMVPKLVAIQLSWTDVFLGSGSSFKEDQSYTSSTPIPVPAPVPVTSVQNRPELHLSARSKKVMNLDLKGVNDRAQSRNELPPENTGLAVGTATANQCELSL